MRVAWGKMNATRTITAIMAGIILVRMDSSGIAIQEEKHVKCRLWRISFKCMRGNRLPFVSGHAKLPLTWKIVQNAPF